jgi:hypothetical protein
VGASARNPGLAAASATFKKACHCNVSVMFGRQAISQRGELVLQLPQL